MKRAIAAVGAPNRMAVPKTLSTMHLGLEGSGLVWLSRSRSMGCDFKELELVRRGPLSFGAFTGVGASPSASEASKAWLATMASSALRALERFFRALRFLWSATTLASAHVQGRESGWSG